ncbi:MAG TPA: sulfite exporter TauE/SafE family protein [Candidatus Saccharimonadia bacterium]|jgi:hypothetical protein
MNVVILVVAGLVCGTLAGMIGIAGGILLIPVMIYILGFSQKMATGTMLAVMLPPIGLGAAYVYWRNGNVNLKAALFIALGFFIGGIIGANGSSHVSTSSLTRLLGLITAVVSVKMLFFS